MNTAKMVRERDEVKMKYESQNLEMENMQS